MPIQRSDATSKATVQGLWELLEGGRYTLWNRSRPLSLVTSGTAGAHYQNYEANNVEGLQALWSSELELYPNSTDAIGVAEISDFVNAHHENFSDIKLTWGEEDDGIDVWVETASYDNGFTVTQTWFNWVATGKNSGDSYNVPFHITFVWDENGKIAQEYHFGVDQLEKEMAAASASEE